VSETVLDHGYIPEEHAPDPVISHGDPTPPGKVGIWLFLASEIMFFVAILGSYVILRSGSHELFAKHALALSKPLAGINTLVLIFSSLTMALAVDASQKGKRNKTILCLFITFICAAGFLGIKAIEYTSKFKHHTIVARESKDGPLYVYDGHLHENDGTYTVLEGYRMAAPEHGSIDIHLISERDVMTGGAPETAAQENAEHKAAEEFKIPNSLIAQDMNYGPWKNIFYADYFTLTGIHGLHVVGGMFPLAFLCIFAIRGKLLPHHTEYVGLYWHFVDLVWIFLFPLLYLI
jgi:cytochrome c oxidase subunit 3